MLSAASVVVLAAGLGAYGLAALRWLRVAQREHYLAGSVLRFAARWWSLSWWQPALLLLGWAFALGALAWLLFGLLGAVVAGAGPVGLSLRGRTSRLAFTRRLRTLAGATGLLGAGGVTLCGLRWDWRGAAVAAVLLGLAAPAVVDLALALLAPVESRVAARYVDRASRRLAEIHPVVLAITGSYGKTTTKGYAAELLAGRFQVLASPRSYNNQAGLARTVNELLVAGTDVLVAEMGTYGPGELAHLCSWLTPTVSVITAIGPVHLERFGSLEKILEAKAEITTPARASVLNVDDPLLASLAERLECEGRRVVRCSGSRPETEVAVVQGADGVHVHVGGEDLGVVALAGNSATIALSNVACAFGAAIELGCSAAELLGRLGSLPVAENRLQVRSATSGAAILDDTFNSNPAGTRLALGALAAIPAKRRIVVTPGMVELGTMQAAENEAFGAAAGQVATDVVVVGRTNRRALLAGLRSVRQGGAPVVVHLVSHREQASEFVRANLGGEDAVLYENDLPDHFP